MRGHYLPLQGMRVLDIGILIPPALTTAKLAALGAEVVKVEMPETGDRIRHIPPFGPDKLSAYHMTHDRGKRSIALNLRDDEDRTTFLRLAQVADVIVENQLPGTWRKLGIDFAELRQKRPELIICSITAFGQTGPFAQLPSHGLNMDALADALPVDWSSAIPRVGWIFTSWGTEIASACAALAVTAAFLSVRTGGEGAWIDLSGWDAAVECHRVELGKSFVSGSPFNMHGRDTGELYNTYVSSDGKAVLIAALEGKFWRRFCEGVGRPDLIDKHHSGRQLEYAFGDSGLRTELEAIFATATAEEWLSRFMEWGVPGSPVLEIPDVMKLPHFAARGIMEGDPGEWPNIMTAVRWHHTDERAGSGMASPPAVGGDTESVLREWLG